MDSRLHEDPSHEAQQPVKPKPKWALWLVFGLTMYGTFIGVCFYMESEARARFQVPSQADVDAIDDRVARIRTENARDLALAEMREWRPYAIYSAGAGIVVLGGSALVTIFGALAVWRGVRRDSARKARVIVMGVLLVMLASLVLLGWPPIVAERHVEAKKTMTTDATSNM